MTFDEMNFPADISGLSTEEIRQLAYEIRKFLIKSVSKTGGHLASTASTHYVDAATRPDFQILVYPVITFEKPYTHDGSVFGLLGDNPSQEMLDLYSNQKQVTPETPPAFILAATDDFLVPVKNSLLYYEALVDNKVSATMHIYPSGGHGFGWGDNYIYKTEWSEELEKWFDTVVLK